MRLARWLCTALLLVALACSQARWDGLLFDFESDAELNQFHWRCGQLFSLSEEHVTHGAHSLRLELYPSAYPGLRPAITRRDWSRFRTLCFDVYNPQKEVVRLSIRIDDVRDRLEHADRFNSAIPLAPGLNRVRIPLAGLVTSGTGRRLDTSDIWAVYIFVSHPRVKKVLFVDYMRLE